MEGKTWSGNVEIHIRASDWFAHGHEKDSNYSNVILHVVWECDTEVFGKDQLLIPTLQLKDHVNRELLSRYFKFFSHKNPISLNCHYILESIPWEISYPWITRMYTEKLEESTATIRKLAIRLNHDWENLYFLLLFRRFGGNINGKQFLDAAERIPFKLVLKLKPNRLQLEALFFGMTGLLNDPIDHDPYFNLLKKEFKYLKFKFKLCPDQFSSPGFYKLRPLNFPTIRLAQLASLYHHHHQLLNDTVLFTEHTKVFDKFKVDVSPYWQTHYVFGKASAKRKKLISQVFIESVISNVIIPLRIYYFKTMGKLNIEEELEFPTLLRPEKNAITRKFERNGVNNSNALVSHGLIHLYKNYCMENRCLHCVIGHYALKGK